MPSGDAQRTWFPENGRAVTAEVARWSVDADAPAASDDRCLDVTAGPNPLQHSIQFVS